MTQPLRRIFLVPALVGLASLIGLLAALVGDGAWDVVSWVTLGWVLVLAIGHGSGWLGRRRRRATPPRR